MKNFFLDTNVVIDILADRTPFSVYTAKLFDYAEKGKVKLYLSALSYSNIYYIIKKTCTHKEMVIMLKDLEAITQMLDVTKSIVSKSLHSEFKDFEDAIQYHTALSYKKMDAIVTRNGKDYKRSTMAILTPEEALSVLQG